MIHASAPPSFSLQRRKRTRPARATGAGGKAGRAPGFASVHVADQVDAAAENKHRRNGPQNQNWHVSTSLLSLTSRSNNLAVGTVFRLPAGQEPDKC
jgi:hypothetical protein